MPDYHENPLSLELKSLRTTVARFQEEAHASAVKLQRHSLDAVRVYERAGQLERENDLLKAELAILRANPHSESAASAKHVQDQLTLSLRRQSQKTTLAEETIAARTAEIAQLRAEVYRAQVAAESAYELGARVRAREEELKTRQREMGVRIGLLEEDLRMADGVIQEYAALVRGMEKSTSTTQAASVSRVLDEARKAHDSLVARHQVDTEYMQTELQAMLTRLEVTMAQLEAEKKAKEALEQELGRTQAELENHRLDDATAAKMVARYMQFSQTSTNDLLATLSALKARHEGTLSTLSAQNHQLALSLASLSAQNDRLRDALDEAGGELAKEAYGRRREVALRIRMGRRETRLVEGLRRWVRGAEERLAKLTHAQEHEILAGVVQGARIVLEQMDEGVADVESAVVMSGDGARQFLVDDGVEGLLEELRVEMERRVQLEKALVQSYGQPNGHDTPLDLGQTDGRKPAMKLLVVVDDSTPPQVPEKSPMLPPRPKASSQDVAPDHQIAPDDRHDKSPPETDHKDHAATSTVLDTRPPDHIEVAPANHTSDPHVVHGGDKDQIESNDSPDSVDSDTTPLTNILPGDILAKATEPVAAVTPSLLYGVGHSADAERPGPLAGPIPLSADAPAQSSKVESIGLPIDTLPPDSTLADASSSSSVPLSSTLSTLSPSLSGHSSPTTPTDVGNFSTETQEISKMPDSEYQLGEDEHGAPDGHIAASPTALPEEMSPDRTIPPIVSPAPLIALSVPVPAPVALAPLVEPAPSLSPPPPPPPHPLLADLARVSKRYDSLQRAFRDCHLALEDLQAALKDSSSAPGNGSTPSALPIPPHVLTAAVARLDDYTEDARVELEIRVGDEVLLAKGYEALLSVPGAMLSGTAARKGKRHMSMPASEGDTDADGGDGHDGKYDEPVQSEVERQIADFVAGTDPAVRRARDGLGRKLEDVQHDIAALKRAIFDPDAFVPPSASTHAPHSSTSHSPSSSATNLALPSSAPVQAGSWSSWIRTSTLSSRPSSPVPPSHGPTPTFGNIMTTPRLRSSPSTTSLRQQQPQQDVSRSRRPSFFGLPSTNVPEKEKDPLAVLGLKVPMPSFAFGFGATSPPLTSGSPFGFGTATSGGAGFPGIMSPTSPMAPMIHAAPGGPRSRSVSSTMYMLGLGASATALPRMAPRSVSGAPASASPLASEVKSPEAATSKRSQTSEAEKNASRHGIEGESDSYGNLEGGNDSDIE